VLIVDDLADVRRICRVALSADGLSCDEVGTGPDAVEAATRRPYDLVLLDVDLPGLSGAEVLRRLRQFPSSPHMKIIMFSGARSGDELSHSLLAGADDFVTKPFSVVQLRARVQTALRLRAAQFRSDQLNRDLLSVNAELEKSLAARDAEIIHARNGMVLAFARLIERRSAETGSHLIRLQRYCRVLAECAAELPAFRPCIDAQYIRMLEDCSPLHDIGKTSIPDHILNKPGSYTPEELRVMQSHTTIGAETLREVARQHPFALGFLHMAIDIARSHHERWDGTGYPDRLQGEGIPLSARILAIADVYDALRARRVYKLGMPHEEAVRVMTANSPGHFDPALLGVFKTCTDEFARVFGEVEE
jgi:response regulator RpfG family c-di-GMP phosphodiesterase